MADDLSESMDDLKDEIKRLTEKIPIVASYRQFQAGALPPSRGIGDISAEEIAWGMGGAGIFKTAGFARTAFKKTIAQSEFLASLEAGSMAESRLGSAAVAEAGGIGAYASRAKSWLFGTPPKPSPYAGTPGVLGKAYGTARKVGTAAALTAVTAVTAKLGWDYTRPRPEQEDIDPASGFPWEAISPFSYPASLTMWQAEEASQAASMRLWQSLESKDPKQIRAALDIAEKTGVTGRAIATHLQPLAPTLAAGQLAEGGYWDIYEESVAGMAEPFLRPEYVEKQYPLEQQIKREKEDLAFRKEDLSIEKAQLAMLTTEYDVNKESIKEWTTVRFAGETAAQESIQNVKYEILEQQKLALAYSSTLDEIEAYRTTRSNLSNEMTLSIATTNLEMVNEAKGSAQKERLTVDLEKLRAEKGLHTAQTAVTVGEMQLEMSSYNDVQLKIGELQNTLSGLETDYSLKFERMRNDVKFFVQAHEDASSILPESAQVVVDALTPLLSRQDEVNTSIENFKTSISDKEGTIISYRTQIQGLTGDLNALAAAQRMESELSGGSYTYTSMPSDTQSRQIDPISSGGGGSDWASAGGHFDEFGRRISVVPIYSS